VAEDTPRDEQNEPAEDSAPAPDAPAPAQESEPSAPAPDAPAPAQSAPAPAAEEPAGDAPAPPAPEPVAAEPTPPAPPVAPEAVADEATPPAPAATTAGPPAGEVPPAAETPAAAEASEPGTPAAAAEDEDADDPTPRAKPAVPGADLEVDIVPEGVDPLAREGEDPYALDDEARVTTEDGEDVAQPIATAAIDLAAGARYRATGKRKTAIARVILRPGSGVYLVNGHALDVHFPRATLQRNIRQPLETVGYESRMDVVARLQGGGISAQAGALRHGISRALLEADPNLRGELKRRGFLTRDSRAKERKKAGLKKARKRPQFSKR
jgi:small subunit ribosomal protein S9